MQAQEGNIYFTELAERVEYGNYDVLQVDTRTSTTSTASTTSSTSSISVSSSTGTTRTTTTTTTSTTTTTTTKVEENRILCGCNHLSSFGGAFMSFVALIKEALLYVFIYIDNINRLRYTYRSNLIVIE